MGFIIFVFYWIYKKSLIFFWLISFKLRVCSNYLEDMGFAFANVRAARGVVSRAPVAPLRFASFGGETGIRTLGELPHNSFQDYRLQPLGHLSVMCFFIEVTVIYEKLI